MGTVLFRRPPRQPPPAMPKGELLFEAPPELPEVGSGSSAQRALGLLPMLAGGASLAFLFSTGAGTIRLVAGGMMAVSMFGMYLSQMGGRGGERKAEIDGRRRDYLRYLAQLRSRIRQAAAHQRAALEWRYPDPDLLWALPLTRRLWERRAADPDFGHVRVARGPQRFALQLIAPETKPVEDLEPVSAGALRRFLRTHRTVPDLPVALSLRAFALVRCEGERGAVEDLVRAMLAHLVVFHPPHQLLVAVCAAPDRLASWDWVKWLPHALHPTRDDGVGPVRLVASSLRELEDLLADDLDDRSFFSPSAAPLTDRPHVVVVLDGGHVTAESRLASAPPQGTTLVDLTGSAAGAGGDGALRLRVGGAALAMLEGGAGTDRQRPLGRPDRLAAAQLQALARQLAPYRSLPRGAAADEEEAGADGGTAPVTDLTLTSLLGASDARALDPALAWRSRPARERLRIPFGVGGDGRPVELDIKESAQGGMGPHGLVIGATGSGKSELLRTLVLGLAMTHSPDALNLVLVDFKGGATFLGLDGLPHVSAVITNLEEELVLVDRMHDALAGEMNRRQELLRRAGNYASLRDYEAAREQGEPLDPMPSLWVVVDEFSELLSAKPEFIELFVMIGRLGRSLGVHLLLASQRLEEGKLRGLDTHLSYRIGLRTFSAGESRVVLGVPDAYELPSEPGNGYLKFATEGLVRFKAAYVSGSYQAPRPRPLEPAATGVSVAARPGPAAAPAVLAYTVDRVDPPAPEASEAGSEAVAAAPSELALAVPEGSTVAPAEQASEERPRSLLEVVVDRLHGQGGPAHQVWLPPLAEPPTLDQLLPPLEVTDGGLAPSGWEDRGRLRVPVALVDKPYDQRRDPLWLDLSGATGHVGIVGGPQSGKSTLLRALICSFALTHRPDEAQFYALDFGGGTLPSLTGLPHVGGVATRLDADAIRRTVGELTTLLEERERTFTEHGIDGIGTYRRLRRAGRIEPDRFAPDVFLVVDGWATVRQDYEQLEQTITTQLGARGLGFGIHLVLTATKWSDFRMALKDLVQTRLELRLGDAYDSEIDRKVAAGVPANRPGRGLSPEGLHCLGALPRIDGVSDDQDVADGVKAMVEAVAGAWHGEPAPPVRLLPTRLPVEELRAAELRMAEVAGAPAGRGLAIGIDEAELAPVRLDFAEEPHFVAIGANECGKSNLLALIAQGVAARHDPAEARMIVVDYRRSLLETVQTDHLIGYAASSDAARSLMNDLGAALRKRLPGPDLSPAELRSRSWWSGADVYVIVDDYELVATSSGNPLQPLTELVSQARDIGLHVVLARGFGGAGRAMFDPIVQRIRDLGCPGLIMSGNRDEGALWSGVRGQPLPPGRGTLVSRRLGTGLIQTAVVGDAASAAGEAG